MIQSEKEGTLSELDEKLEVLIEMLKNRKDTLAKQVKAHYKKQEIFLLEAQKNVDRRSTNLTKLEMKLQKLFNQNPQNENKLERFEQEFISINKNYDTPFHQFKHCTVSLHPQSKSRPLITPSPSLILTISHLQCPPNFSRTSALSSTTSCNSQTSTRSSSSIIRSSPLTKTTSSETVTIRS